MCASIAPHAPPHTRLSPCSSLPKCPSADPLPPPPPTHPHPATRDAAGEVLEAQQAKAAAKLAAERDKRKAKKAAKAGADGGAPGTSAAAGGGDQSRKRSASPPPMAGAGSAAAAMHAAKRIKGAAAKAVGHMPAGSSKDVFASLFTSSSKGQGLDSAAETFCCRALSSRGLNLT